MNILKSKSLTAFQKEQICNLWNNEYPVKLNDRFPILLDGVEKFNHYIIENENNQIIAWAVDFEKDGETRFSIIVDSLYQGKGLGSLLVEKLKQENKLFFGWVIDHHNDLKSDGTHYESPIKFYLNHGFEMLNSMRIDNEMLSAIKIKWQR